MVKSERWRSKESAEVVRTGDRDVLVMLTEQGLVIKATLRLEDGYVICYRMRCGHATACPGYE